MKNRLPFFVRLTRILALIASPLLLASHLQADTNSPLYSHVVVVVEENHGFNDIIGGDNASYAPYINDVLATGGVVLTNAYGEQHPSQPNYYWLFSGSNQGISNDGSVGPAFTSQNLYTELQSRFTGTAQSNNFFGGYVDNFPGAGNAYTDTNNYVPRHVPWLGFSNINSGDPAAITQDFATSFPTNAAGFQSLPVFSFVTPDLIDDMHYATNPPNTPEGANNSNAIYSQSAISTGDAWLSNNLGAYAAWAKSNNSLLIVTWDEDHSADWTTNAITTPQNGSGLTAPNLGPSSDSNSGPNQIPMIFYGANLATNGLVGTFGANSNGVNNLNLYDTLQSFYGITNYGTQSDVAAAAGLVSAPISDIFTVPEPSTMALAVLGSMALLIAMRRRGSRC